MERKYTKNLEGSLLRVKKKLSPESNDSHGKSTKPDSNQVARLVLLRLGTEPLRVQDITSQQRHKRSVQQHTTSDRVADTCDNQVLDTVGTVTGAHTHTDRHTKGSDEGKDQDQNNREPLLLESQIGDTGTQGDTLKELMEANGDGHGQELGAGEDSQGDADED